MGLQSESFEDVAAEVSRPILHYLEGLVGDRTTAEDLVQETLIRMSKGFAGFRGDASVKTWAFTIATRVASDHFRKPENRLRIVGVDEAADLPDPGAAVEDEVVLKEMGACIRQLIDTLPGSYRAPLVLHDVEGLSIAETATACDSTIPATKIRIHRARRRLEEALRARCNLYHDSRNVLRCDRAPEDGEGPTKGSPLG